MISFKVTSVVSTLWVFSLHSESLLHKTESSFIPLTSAWETGKGKFRLMSIWDSKVTIIKWNMNNCKGLVSATWQAGYYSSTYTLYSLKPKHPQKSSKSKDQVDVNWWGWLAGHPLLRLLQQRTVGSPLGTDLRPRQRPPPYPTPPPSPPPFNQHFYSTFLFPLIFGVHSKLNKSPSIWQQETHG